MTALTHAVDDYKSQDGAQSLSVYATNKKDREGSKAWNHKFMQWKGEEIEGMRSAEGAEALGWLLYQANEVAEAETWFKTSADWSPSESAALGLVVTSHRLHHDKDYAKWVAQYRATYPQVAQLASTLQSHAAPARVAPGRQAPHPRRSESRHTPSKNPRRIGQRLGPERHGHRHGRSSRQVRRGLDDVGSAPGQNDRNRVAFPSSEAGFSTTVVSGTTPNRSSPTSTTGATRRNGVRASAWSSTAQRTLTFAEARHRVAVWTVR